MATTAPRVSTPFLQQCCRLPIVVSTTLLQERGTRSGATRVIGLCEATKQ